MRPIDYRRLGEDFSLRYDGCYIRYRTRGVENWDVVYVGAVNTNSSRFPSIQLQSQKHGTMTVVYNTEGEFDFMFPETGYFNWNRNGYMFSRHPQRQNKRSMCLATSTRKNFYSTIARGAAMAPLDLDVANCIFNPKYVSRETAIESLNSNRSYCVALDKRFGVGLSVTDSPHHLLFHNLTPIAEVTKEGRLHKCFDPMFERFIGETSFQ